MATCTTASNFVGKTVAAGWVVGCGDLDFENATYKTFGTINSKTLTFTGTTTENTNDLSGPDTSMLLTRRGGEFTVSGFATTNDSVTSNQNELIQYYHDELDAGRQTSVWIKVSGPQYPRIYYIFAILTNIEEGFNTDDPATVSFTFSTTDTGVGGTPAVNLRTPAP